MSIYRTNQIELLDNLNDSFKLKIYKVSFKEYSDYSYRPCVFCGKPNSKTYGYIEPTTCHENRKYFWRYGFLYLRKKYCTFNGIHFHYTCNRCEIHWVYFPEIDKNKINSISI